jgi:hypothetical protein
MPGLPHVFVIVKDYAGARESLTKFPDHYKLFIATFFESVVAAKQRLAETSDIDVRAIVVDYKALGEGAQVGNPQAAVEHFAPLVDNTMRALIGVTTFASFHNEFLTVGCNVITEPDKLHVEVGKILCQWGHITATELATLQQLWDPPKRANGDSAY